jgi:hypothetical protein
MHSQPASVVIVEAEAEFRAWVRAEFKHLREMQQHTNATLELILKTLKKDEEQAEHG